MTDLTLRNLLAYTLLWALNGIVICLSAAIAAGAVWGFGDGGFFAPIAPAVGAGLGLVGTALAMWLAANRPRLGREDISVLVNQIGHFDAKALLQGFAHGHPSVLTDDELTRMAHVIVNEIKAEMQEAA